MWKWALISGASAGIGQALARDLASRGVSLILVARRKDRLDDLASELTAQYQIRVHVIVSDLTMAGAALKLSESVKNLGVQVDLLINNAGLGVHGPFHTSDLNKILHMNQLNIQSLVELTHYFVQPMIAQGQGCILNVASVAGFQALPNFAAYAATKSYVNSLSEALAYELGPKGIQVSALCPGPVETEFFEVAGMNPKGLRGASIQKAQDVAKIAVDGLLNKKVLIITHWMYKVSLLIQRLLPRKLVTKLSGIMAS